MIFQRQAWLFKKYFGMTVEKAMNLAPHSKVFQDQVMTHVQHKERMVSDGPSALTALNIWRQSPIHPPNVLDFTFST